MKRNWRLVLAIIVLAFSLTFLAWGFWPPVREKRVLPVEPSNLVLPTPASFNQLTSSLA